VEHALASVLVVKRRNGHDERNSPPGTTNAASLASGPDS